MSSKDTNQENNNLPYSPNEPQRRITDTTSELRQNVKHLHVVDNIHGETVDYVVQLPDSQVEAILALLAAQKQRWDLESRISELQLLARASPLPYPDPIEKEYQSYRLKRIAELRAALDGVIGKQK